MELHGTAMKGYRTTIVLLVVFFGVMGAAWWAQYARIPTAQQQRAMADRVLPELLDVAPGEIQRAEVRPGAGPPLVFERRAGDRWQMVLPVDAAATSSMVESLIRNLKDLRKLPNAGTIKEPVELYGLTPPSAVVFLFGKDPEQPLAALQVGRAVREQRYVRPLGDLDIQVVEARSLGLIDVAASNWRDKSVFDLPTFAISSVEVTGPGRDLKMERNGGHWLLLRPVRAPADDAKVEGLLANLTELEALQGSKGFVADNVQDFRPYGLDQPTLKLEIRSFLRATRPEILFVGKPVPGHPEMVYARRGDQDDVIQINAKNLNDLGQSPIALRSKRLAQIDLAHVTFVRCEAFDRDFLLKKTRAGWEMLKPVQMRADDLAIQSLLARLNDIQASELLDPEKVAEPGFNPPTVSLDIWQGDSASQTSATEPDGDPAVRLQFGRHDLLRKAIYARVTGDTTLLALPDGIVHELPQNELAFRNRSILALNPGQVGRLTLQRDGVRYVVEPARSTNRPNAWRMVQPVEAPADVESVTRALAILSGLRAESLIAEKLGDGKEYGLDAPAIRVEWTQDAAGSPADLAKKGKPSSSKTPGAGTNGSLAIARRGPTAGTWYAATGDAGPVFTLSTAAVQPFQAEFHDRRVPSFPLEQLEQLTLIWPDRTLGFTRHPRVGGGPADWRPAFGIDTSQFDMSRLNALAESLSRLTTSRFVQYSGVFPVRAGFEHPRLVVHMSLTAPLEGEELRVGGSTPEGLPYATTARGNAGPVFVLDGGGWSELLRSNPPIAPGPELPANVFGPPSPGPNDSRAPSKNE
jgi:hypothetical protein